ncbi:MAG: tRNA (cytidine(34)-2'-O)-methyltransferase [Rhodocyclaceae bacterium]|nr:tRNA (cytidine(34)-2'-O)-methyltransferase [Rhodocyclaceae bacterium]
MFHIVLYQPEIPPNTGNIMRLCANAGASLHLVRPLGFKLDDKSLARAGMDYRDRACLHLHEDWSACQAALAGRRLFALTTKAERGYQEPSFSEGDAFLFGPETRGLPRDILDGLPTGQRLRIPMLPDSRSMNLSNTVAVVLFEAWRQAGFAGAS